MRLHPAVIAGMSAAVLAVGCGGSSERGAEEKIGLPTEQQISTRAQDTVVRLVQKMRDSREYDQGDPHASFHGTYNLNGYDILRTSSARVTHHRESFSCEKEVVEATARYQHGNPANVDNLRITDSKKYSREDGSGCDENVYRELSYVYEFPLVDGNRAFEFLRGPLPLDRISYLTNVFSLMQDAETALDKSTPGSQ